MPAWGSDLVQWLSFLTVCKLMLCWGVNGTIRCTPLRYKHKTLGVCIHCEVTHVCTPASEDIRVTHQRLLVPIYVQCGRKAD